MYAYFGNSDQNIETQKKKKLLFNWMNRPLFSIFFFEIADLLVMQNTLPDQCECTPPRPLRPNRKTKKKENKERKKKTAGILGWVCAIAHRELVSGFSSHPSFYIYICILNKKDGKNESMRVRSALFTDQSVSFARIFCQRLPFLSLSCTTTTTTTRERGKRRQECASAFIASVASPRNPNPASNPTSTYRNFRARKEE